MAYDAVESLDPAGAILRGFSSSSLDSKPADRASGWEKHYALMSKNAVKKNG